MAGNAPPSYAQTQVSLSTSSAAVSASLVLDSITGTKVIGPTTYLVAQNPKVLSRLMRENKGMNSPGLYDTPASPLNTVPVDIIVSSADSSSSKSDISVSSRGKSGRFSSLNSTSTLPHSSRSDRSSPSSSISNSLGGRTPSSGYSSLPHTPRSSPCVGKSTISSSRDHFSRVSTAKVWHQF